MDTENGGRRQRRGTAQWAALIDSHARSGLSQRAFCEAQGLSLTRFRLTLHSTPSGPPETDAVDQSILEALSAGDGLSTHQIAVAVGRTPRTTPTRLIKLVDRGLVREVGVSAENPKRLYYRTH